MRDTPAGEVPDWLGPCVDGDPAARQEFQSVFGEDIYNFPVKIYGADPDKAADFYVYAFERDRIWNRLRSFEGRNQIQFRTFLSYYVLKAIFLEWQRTQKDLQTVSLSDPLGEDGGTLEDVLPAEEQPISNAGPVEARRMLEKLSPQERLDLKLLSLLEHDLAPEDLRQLADLSGRSIKETMADVAEIRDGLRAKDAKVAGLRDELDSTWGWILVRDRELQQIDEKLRLLGTREDPRRADLERRRDELAKAVAKRNKQRDRVLEELRKYKVTTSYKDIARLVGSTTGTICSRIFRLRQKLETMSQAEAAMEGSAP